MSSEYLRALQTSWRGWAVSKAVHSMECRGGAHALLEGYLSVGAAACDALHCQHWEVNYLKLVLTLKEPNNRLTDLGYAWVVFIVGDTLRHQPMVVSHMSVLQFRGPITFCVLQWCHPMLTGTQRRTSCSTRMITLYGDHVIKLDSGPRSSRSVLRSSSFCTSLKALSMGSCSLRFFGLAPRLRFFERRLSRSISSLLPAALCDVLEEHF